MKDISALLFTIGLLKTLPRLSRSFREVAMIVINYNLFHDRGIL